MKKTTIPAIFKEDLIKLLESIHEYESILQGERACRTCGRMITVDNIQLIIPRANNIYEYTCSNLPCVEDANISSK